MATSRPPQTGAQPTQAYVWAWLPGATDPVTAGIVWLQGSTVWFRYGSSYLARDDAIPLYAPELPLVPDPIAPLDGLSIAGCINDAGPDAWGQRVILHRRLGAGVGSADTTDLNPITYLLESGTDRIGGLDFQERPDQYVPRHEPASLDQLIEGAKAVERGVELPEAIGCAFQHASSIGGARPKVLLRDGERTLIAKLQSSGDQFPVVKAEGVAMELARRVGLNVASVDVTRVAGLDVLLVERFDRPTPNERRIVISALTMLQLDELAGRYATYVELADLIRAAFSVPRATLRELFARIAFNIHVGNTDDHARNHAAFWDGTELTLTPAYDIQPCNRTGRTAEQAMAYDRVGNRWSRTSLLVSAAEHYLLDPQEAQHIVDSQRAVIEGEWDEAADVARLTPVERAFLWRRQILNPYIDE